MAIGRPTKYKPEYCQMLIDHMSQGLSFESFAAVADCCDDTLREWEKTHDAFSAARKKGSANAKLFWEKMGVAGAAGRVKNFQTAAWIFNMKNRFRWSDKQEVFYDNKPFIMAYNPDEKPADDSKSDKVDADISKV